MAAISGLGVLGKGGHKGSAGQGEVAQWEVKLVKPKMAAEAASASPSHLISGYTLRGPRVGDTPLVEVGSGPGVAARYSPVLPWGLVRL